MGGVTLFGAIGWPVLDRFRIGSKFAISPHGLGIALGFLIGAWILTREGPKRGVSVEHINTMVFWALIGAIIGARLFYVIAHYSEFNGFLDMLKIYNGGISLLGGIAGAVLVNLPLMRRYGYRFFQVMDPAVIGLSFGIFFGRTGDLVIGDHLGKPTSWLLAFQYHGGNLPGPWQLRAPGTWVAQLSGGFTEIFTRHGATLAGSNGLIEKGVGVHPTALYDMISTGILFLVLYRLSWKPRRLGILTLTFASWYGSVRVVTDFLRIDKRFFGLTGSQWTGLTVSSISIVTLVVWALGSRRSEGSTGPPSSEVEAAPAPPG